MVFKFRTNVFFCFVLFLSIVVIITAQNYQFTQEKPQDNHLKVTWCTVNRQEQNKCKNWAIANERDKIRVNGIQFKLECYQAFNKDECMSLLDEEKVTMTTLDAGEVFVGGRYHSLVPIAQEILEGGFKHYYSVAVIKKDTLHDVQSLRDLRGKRACFAGVETFAGWVIPIYTMMREGGLEIVDCNNHVKSAINFFGPSCAVNCLTNRYNPVGDNSDRLCQLCIGKIPGGRCTDADPYAGYDGAFRCLLEAGDIAFLKHTTIPELVAGDEFISLSKDSFELLCKDGSRRSVDDYLSCNWGRSPSNAIVISSATTFDQRKYFQLFLNKTAALYYRKSNYSHFDNNKDREQERDQNNYYGQEEYDQFGNRLNRFKRQNFNPIPYEPNPNIPYGNSNNRNNDPNRSNQQNDPFSNDPFRLNKEQYGINIDPYGTIEERDRNRNGFQYNDTTVQIEPNYDLNNGTLYEDFNLFESTPRYGIKSNLLFQDLTKGIAPVNENQQTYANFLGDSMNIILGVRDCQVNRMTLCVTSDMENQKCVKMKTALKAQLLKPEMDCYKGHSQIHCMQAIRAGTADVTVLDASDVYTAGLNFDLVPFISEVYNLNEPEYYVVAVAKESDPSTEITYLRGKNTCHGGINTAAGWVYPMALLISNGWIRPYGCNSIRAAAEYFSKSCVPGAISAEYNTDVPYDNMCDLCHGVSFRYCRRDASEDYYGHTGAFRCLVEGGGHVAFVKHTTVTENTGGKRKEWWARDNLNDDFELLCPDGTRAEINDYKRCNLGRVKANAIVTRGGYGYNETYIKAYTNLFLYAQTFYGRKTSDEFSFSMFSSVPPYHDLIFQDATTQLKPIPPEKRNYVEYLGSDFMRARRIVDCHAGSKQYNALIILLISCTLSAFYL